jgi:hypothetical protein
MSLPVEAEGRRAMTEDTRLTPTTHDLHALPNG